MAILMDVQKLTTQEQFVQQSLKKIETAFMQREHEYFLIGLSGGSTPFPVYAALSQSNTIDFSKVVFALTDERYVPVNDKDSNYGSIRKALFDPIEREKNIQPQTIFFHTDLPPANCLKRYEKEMEKILANRNESFDLLILGIGPDGHIASLFPGNPDLHEKEKIAVQTRAPQAFAVAERLSVTLPQIKASKEILVLLSGANKKPILERLQEKSEMKIEDFPAAVLKNHPNSHIHFCLTQEN